MIRAWLDSTVDQFDTDQNNLAFNVGGGVMYSTEEARRATRRSAVFPRACGRRQARGRLVQGLRLLAHHRRGHSGVPTVRRGFVSSKRANFVGYLRARCIRPPLEMATAGVERVQLCRDPLAHMFELVGEQRD